MAQGKTIAKQQTGGYIRSALLMLPIIAAMANPSLVSTTANAIGSALPTASAFPSPDFGSFASAIGQEAPSRAGFHASAPLYVSGGPIYLPHYD